MLMSKKDWNVGQELYRQAQGLSELELFKQSLSFERLESGSYASIDKHYRLITFPENFKPTEGCEYDCEVYHTKTGVFVYKGERYRVRRAYLKMSYEEYATIHNCSSSAQKPKTFGDLFQVAQRNKK